MKFVKWTHPLKASIKMFDHDCHITSKVYPIVCEIKRKYTQNAVGVPTRYKDDSMRCLIKRWEWMKFDIHYAEY